MQTGFTVGLYTVARSHQDFSSNLRQQTNSAMKKLIIFIFVFFKELEKETLHFRTNSKLKNWLPFQTAPEITRNR